MKWKDEENIVNAERGAKRETEKMNIESIMSALKKEKEKRWWRCV